MRPKGVLSAIDQAGVKAGLAMERRVIRKAMKVVERGALNATMINDDGLDDQGSEVILNERDKRIARDLRKSKRHAPVYLEVLLRRLEAAEKLDAMKDQGPKLSLNVGKMVVVQAVPYPVQQLPERKDDDR